MDEALGGEAMGRALLGNEIYDQLQLNAEAFNENAQAIGTYKGTLEAASTFAATFEYALGNLYMALMQTERTDLADKIGEIATSVQDARIAFDAGLISATEFERKMGEASAEAQIVMANIQGIDGIDLSNVMGKIAGMLELLKRTASAALSVRTALASGPATAMAGAGASGAGTVNLGLGPISSPRPKEAPQTVDFGLPDISGGSSGGGSGNSLTDELARMQEQFASESELLDIQYQERLTKLEEFRNAKMLSEQQFNEMEAKVKEDHERRLADIEQQRRNERLDAFASAFGDMASLMQSGNEKLFKIGQAFAIAEATIDGIKAATAAWRKGMEIGGPGLAAAFTAASLVKTGSMIAQIASQTSRGGGSKTSGASGGASAPTAQQNAGTYMNFQFTGGWASQEAMGRFMVDSINEAVKNGATIKGAKYT
jgi:hypothetical protein